MARLQIALEVLGAQAPGAFLVRGSTTQHGCLALSLRVPRDFAPMGIAHYLILRTPKGYKIKVSGCLYYLLYLNTHQPNRVVYLHNI